MSKFTLVKKVDLSEFGDEWKDCYIKFNAQSYKDVKALDGIKIDSDSPQEDSINKAFKLLTDLFIEGQAPTDKGKSQITKEDIEDLPMDVLLKCFKELSGEVSPN